MRISARLSLFAAVALLAGTRPAQAVTVSPTALYLSARNPSALLTLINTGSRPEEIEISFGFGYPTSDSTGALQVRITDSAAADEPSAAAWLRAFPRRLVLQPGQRQVVRVTVVAPAGLADGEYWGRVLVKSRGGEPPIEQTQGQVRMQISLETTFATAVFFQKGAMQTGVAAAASAERVGDGVQLTVDLHREVRAELYDAAEHKLAEAEDVVAVYRRIRRRFLLRGDAPLPAGPLTVRYVADTERPDLPGTGPVRSAPVAGSVAVR
jgi:P pilus assembly chaperone PapD